MLFLVLLERLRMVTFVVLTLEEYLMSSLLARWERANLRYVTR